MNYGAMMVDPDNIRFTQDSISLYFQYPYSHFSIRDAVRRITKNQMSPDEFPSIRVISYNGCLWSVDNRRLWVFRFARCASISVLLVEDMHPRLEQVAGNPGLLCMVERADFFPRVRDGGRHDRDFDRLYPKPSSFQPRKHYECAIKKAEKQAETADFFPKVGDGGDADWDSDRLYPRLCSVQPWKNCDYTKKKALEHVGAADFFRDFRQRADTDPDYARLYPQLCSVKPSRGHDYTESKAQVSRARGRSLLEASDGEDTGWDSDRFDAKLSSILQTSRNFNEHDQQGLNIEHFEVISKGQKHVDGADKEENDRDCDRLHQHLSSLQPSRNSDDMINEAQEHAEGADFFPRVHDRGDNDLACDHLCPQPSSFQLSSSCNYDYMINKVEDDVDSKTSALTATPQTPSPSKPREDAGNKNTSETASPEQTPSTSTVQEYTDKENTSWVALPQTPPTSVLDHTQSGAATSQTLWDGFFILMKSAAMKTINGSFDLAVSCLARTSSTCGSCWYSCKEDRQRCKEGQKCSLNLRSLSRGSRCWASAN